MNQERFPKIVKETPRAEKEILTKEDVKDLAGGFSADKEEIGGFSDFISNKFKKMSVSRRRFLKIAAGAVVGLTIGYKYFKENIDNLWAEYQREKLSGYEIDYSEEMTQLYEEVKNFPERERKPEDINKNLKAVEGELKYIEFIKNSEKKNIGNLVDNLIGADSDVILFGEWHGPESNAKNAVKILGEFKNKSQKKIIKIALEFLDFKDKKSVEYTEKFNKKEVSPEEFYLKGYFRSDIRPLLEFAQKNNILIEGLEDKENFGYFKGLERFTGMSHRVGKLTKEKNENEIVIVFAGAGHTTKKTWRFPEIANHLATMRPVLYISEEAAEIAGEKDYTFKEYLEKLGLRPAVVNLKDLSHSSMTVDNIFGYTYNFLGEEEAIQASNRFEEKWNNYKVGRKEPFWMKESEDIHLFVNPSEIPNTPPALNMFETIRKNHPILYKIIKKDYVDYQPFKYDQVLAFRSENYKSAKIADLDLKTGKVKKLYLPEQEKAK
jgi:hypothetical protein